jgi:choline dehydrogenase-like flavoprotein
MHLGATQGFNSLHFIDSDYFKIETLSLPPELLAVRIPGVGSDLMRKLADYRYVSNWAVLVRSEAEGSVRSIFGKDQVYFTPTPTDMARLRKGLRILTEMMFAVGAKEIWPGVHGVPVLKTRDDLRYWYQAPIDPRAYNMMASHLFGSARMGPDPRDAVVGLDFQVHGLRGMYVVDSSIFPTNLGVNPQHTIMAVARLAALHAADNPLPPVS